MTAQHYDIDWIIVGQGLAGTALAWRLIDAGQRVLVFDPAHAVTSSRIAAGLVTPITGKNLALAWTNEADRAAAGSFYREIERRTGATFFHERIAIRLHASIDDQQRWAKRSAQPAYRSHLFWPGPNPLVEPDIAVAPFGGFAMRAAQLDVAAYLAASARQLPMRRASVDWRRDVALDDAGVSILGQRARGIISCEGYAVTRNPYLALVPSRAAKGEIITIRTARPLPAHTLHSHGIWIAPTATAAVFNVGATFSFDRLDKTPSAAGRAELESKLAAFFRVTYGVIDHHAAVRPIVETNRLVLGRHPRYPALAMFNGLAAKGVLRAPLAASLLTAHLLAGVRLPPDHDVARFTERLGS